MRALQIVKWSLLSVALGIVLIGCVSEKQPLAPRGAVFGVLAYSDALVAEGVDVPGGCIQLVRNGEVESVEFSDASPDANGVCSTDLADISTIRAALQFVREGDTGDFKLSYQDVVVGYGHLDVGVDANNLETGVVTGLCDLVKEADENRSFTLACDVQVVEEATEKQGFLQALRIYGQEGIEERIEEKLANVVEKRDVAESETESAKRAKAEAENKVVEAEKAQAKAEKAEKKVEAERDQLKTANGALTTERDGLKTANGTLTTERDQLKTANGTLTTERDQLKTANGTLTTERDQLKTANGTLTTERDQLKTANGALTTERDGLKTANGTLTTERDQLKTANGTLTTERDQLKATNGTLTTEKQALADKITAAKTKLQEAGNLADIDAVKAKINEALGGL